MTTMSQILAAFLLAGASCAGSSDSPKADGDRVKVLIAYHSVMGHTAALAKAVEEGAKKVPGIEVKRMATADVKCPDLLGADAVVVGSPVYWSNMSAEVKAFFDRWTNGCGVLPPAFEMKDKIGAAFVTGGEVSSGKETTLLTMLIAMLGNRMIVLSEGESLGAAATTGEGKSPVAEKDLEQGRLLGERVARVTLQFRRGRQGK